MNQYLFEPVHFERSQKNKISNLPMIAKILGVLICVEAFMFFVSAIVSILYAEYSFRYFIYCILINLGIGIPLIYWGRGANNELSRHDAYFIVAVTWVVFSTLGMLPFYISGYIPTVTDAFFETMSGFTTTGASILDHIEALPHGMLFWRSLTQWIGGLGIVFFTIAVLPIFGSNNMQLFSAETTGVTHDKIHPKITMMAKYLWSIYLFLTISEVILLMIGGMSLFDAVCHAFATTATGGFSTKQDSVAYWHSPFIEYVVAIFMMLSGVNFTLYFLLVSGKFKRFWKDRELRWYLSSIGLLTLIIMLTLIFHNHYEIELAFRKGFFQVVTAHTSCGFITDDYNHWMEVTWLLLMYAMIVGGCAGSTSGGLKNLRIVILFRNIYNEFKRMIHPRAVLPVKINKQVYPSSVVGAVHTFVLFYLGCILVGWFLLMASGVHFMEAFGTVVSSIGGVGPGLGAFGPAYSWYALPAFAKWVLSFLMLIGRLEIFCVLLLFTKAFWKD